MNDQDTVNEMGDDTLAKSPSTSHGRATATQLRSTIEPGSKPTLWRIEKQRIPPGLAAMLPGIAEVPDLAESMSWNCGPNPWVFDVTWNTGEVDQFYTLSNAIFTIYTYTAAGGGQVALATYAATISPSGIGRSAGAQSFTATLLNSSGGTIQSLVPPTTITIACGEASHGFSWSWVFDAGIYSLIAGAHFSVSEGEPIARC